MATCGDYSLEYSCDRGSSGHSVPRANSRNREHATREMHYNFDLRQCLHTSKRRIPSFCYVLWAFFPFQYRFEVLSFLRGVFIHFCVKLGYISKIEMSHSDVQFIASLSSNFVDLIFLMFKMCNVDFPLIPIVYSSSDISEKGLKFYPLPHKSGQTPCKFSDFLFF